MTKAKLGDWRWYMGTSEDDDEMMDCGTRNAAIAEGRKQLGKGESFWIVEAQMRLRDEDAMANGERDSAPFEATRNGEWIKA